jgi:hypothetical protein
MTSDEGIMVAGISDTAGTTYLRMVKIAASGTTVADFSITDTTLTGVQDIKQTANGGYAILCAAGNHIVFLGIDSAGLVRWRNEYYGYGNATPVNFKVLDDGFVIMGTTGSDPYVIRTDSIGTTTLTGINASAKSRDEISVYPNPARNAISIAGYSQSKNFMLTLYELTGRIACQTLIHFPLYQMNISMLAKGVYILQLRADNGELRNTKLVVE